MGEVKKLGFRPLTIDDNLTKDGLEAISVLTGKECYYIVGGVASQSYLPTSCRRPTSDIDLSIVRPLNYQDFKTFSNPIVEYLLDDGYNIETRKRPRSFNLYAENKEGEKLLIEFSRRNKKSFENSRSKLERELENSKRKIIESRKSTYVVAASEDIVVPKLARTVLSLIRRPELKKNLPQERASMSDKYVRKRLEVINKLREDAMASPGNLELAEEMRVVSDIYDIRILSEIVGINMDYFYESVKDWKVLSEDNTIKDLLFDLVLPKLNTYLNKSCI